MKELQEKIENLGREILSLQEKEQGIKERYQSEEMQRSGQVELGKLHGEIEARKAAMEGARLEILSIKRGSCLEEAAKLAEEKKVLVDRIAEIDKRGQALAEEFDKNIPRRRIQTESSQLLKWERWIQESHLSGLTAKGYPIVTPGEPRREETTTDGLPFRVKSMTEGGWSLCPFQKIEEEPLTIENSREVPMVPTDPVFEAFM